MPERCLNTLLATLWVLCAPTLQAAAEAQETHCPPGPSQVLWGDLHVHTGYSLDAFLFGIRRTPDDAYRFARGEADTLADGTPVRLERPLDFAAVTDHAEYLAATGLCGAGHEHPLCGKFAAPPGPATREVFRRDFAGPLYRSQPICPADAATCRAAADDVWERIRQAAADAYQPCRFTTFVASEWSATPEALHLHRNLIYAGDRVPAIPPNAVDQPTQEDLWRALERSCRAEHGCRVVAIPHNSNIGMGRTFRLDEQDTASLRLRRRFERLAEVFQHKGQSECFPGSPLADDACDFELMLPVPVTLRQQRQPGPLTAQENTAVAGGYLRDTLARGLAVSARTGVNPFQYGLIGSTDTHAARPGYVEEAPWHGTFGDLDDTAEERLTMRHYNPGGLVAVWARANTREEIFDALHRREAYATSGPRILVRFQQTFEDHLPLCDGPAPGTAKMGGTLAAGTGKPRFAVQAMMDRRPLARIDIVKLAFRDGEAVATLVSDSAQGSEPASGWHERCFEWRDDDYRADEPALWYARVLEVPGPRWSASAGAGTDDTIQERAWSSPIWSMPQP